MKSLIKYELKRDRVLIWSVIVGVILFLVMLSYLRFMDVHESDIRGFQGVVLLIGALFILDKRTTHLANDTVFEDREHMMLIPKSILQIVVANCIVAYFDCIILTSISLGIMGIETYSFKLFLRAFIIVNVLFLFYVLITFLYISSSKMVKKPLIASILGGAMLIGIVIIIVMCRTIRVFSYNIELSTFIFGLLGMLGVVGNAATLGHKFKVRKIEAKIMFMIMGLTVISFVGLLYAFNNSGVDNTDLPFVEDKKIIGQWVTVDFTKDYQGYTPKIGELEYSFDTVTFKEDGIIEIDERKRSKWTKGYILNYPIKETTSKYTIQEINGELYMFMEWKNGDYVYFNMKPNYYVLNKIN